MTAGGCRGAAGGMALVLALTLLAPWRGAAQRGELFVEVGGSQVLPPLGVEGEAARFLVGGLRATRLGLDGSGLYGGLLLGRALGRATGGDFVSGEAGASAWWRLSPSWSVGVEGRSSAFDVAEPVPYRAATAEGFATLRLTAGALSARLIGAAGAGRSWVEVVQALGHHQEGTSEELVDDLWRYGGTLEVLGRRGPVSMGVAGGVHGTAGGTFRSAGVRLLAVGGGRALEARLDAWRTPAGTRTTGGVAFILPVGGSWSLRGALGRSEPDPLTLAEPGGGSGGVLVGRRIAGSPSVSPRRAFVHRIVGTEPDGARVRFAVHPPRGAGSVELVGDFTLWEPLAMKNEGTEWVVERALAAGTYHFGFLVDGAWYLPDDAPDAVPDEWGRRSATLVIER
ncbi:MAG: glycogen-binding domain-containing protein [Longimicrobiales bacterium]|nr:glycogen-binding domain-containing protein [Longimicrobiales bacterium]